MKFLVHTVKEIFDISNLPEQLRNLTTTGIKISFVALLFSTLLMVLYIDFKSSNMLFEASSILIQSSSTFMMSFLMFGTFFNRLIKEKNR